MAPKQASTTLDSYNYSSEEENSDDSEYRVEEESSDYSDSSDEEMKSNNSKKRRRELLLKWEEDDEMIVLKEVYEFAGNNGGSYSKKVFYEYVKNKLSKKKVSMNEMSNKIDSLKREYVENENGRKEKGLKFSGNHEREVFLLSRRIWGADYHKNNNRIMVKELEGFVEFVEEREIYVNCLSPSCLEDLKKDWELQLLMYIQVLDKKSKFDVKFRNLVI